MNTATGTGQRRELRYATLAEFAADMEQLAAGEHETTGNWRFAQILKHLRQPMEFSLDGWPFMQPWLLRATVGKLIKGRILKKGMPSGFQLKGKARDVLIVKDDDLSLEDELQLMRDTLKRVETESLLPIHPFFGKLRDGEAYRLHCRHCELHMSFVRPAGDE